MARKLSLGLDGREVQKGLERSFLACLSVSLKLEKEVEWNGLEVQTGAEGRMSTWA